MILVEIFHLVLSDIRMHRKSHCHYGKVMIEITINPVAHCILDVLPEAVKGFPFWVLALSLLFFVVTIDTNFNIIIFIFLLFFIFVWNFLIHVESGVHHGLPGHPHSHIHLVHHEFELVHCWGGCVSQSE